MKIFERMKEVARGNTPRRQEKNEVIVAQEQKGEDSGRAKELQTPDDVAKAANLARRIMNGMVGSEFGGAKSREQKEAKKSTGKREDAYMLDAQGLQAASYQTKEDLPEIIQSRFSNTEDGSGFVRESALPLESAWNDMETMKVWQRDALGRIVRDQFPSASLEMPEKKLDHIREAARAKVENWIKKELDNARFQALEEKRIKLREMGHDGYVIFRKGESYKKTTRVNAFKDSVQQYTGGIYLGQQTETYSYQSEGLSGQVDGTKYQVERDYPEGDVSSAVYTGSVMRDGKNWVPLDREGTRVFFEKFRDLALDLSNFDNEQEKKKIKILQTFSATVDADVRAAYKEIQEESKKGGQVLGRITPKF